MFAWNKGIAAHCWKTIRHVEDNRWQQRVIAWMKRAFTHERLQTMETRVRLLSISTMHSVTYKAKSFHAVSIPVSGSVAGSVSFMKFH